MRISEGVLVLSFTIHPRGTGNRAIVKRLADAARASELGPHIVRVVCGATRLTLHLKSSLALIRAVNAITERTSAAKTADVEGQWPLFA